MVTSSCPLLAAEPALVFSPRVCMQVPHQSAWVPLQVDVAAFVDKTGELNLPALERALIDSVDQGDRLHDETDWPEPATEYDSWLNRRLAIALRGWGDIVARRDADPAALGTLRELEEVAEWACQVVVHRSRHLARSGAWCPALDEAGALVLKKPFSGGWRRRWKKAIREVAVRHRNLTTISPWDVFPRGKPAALAYANLLPLTRFADSVSFQCDVSIDHWNVNEFNSFCERVAAITRCNSGAGLVAKQV